MYTELVNSDLINLMAMNYLVLISGFAIIIIPLTIVLLVYCYRR